MRTIHPDSARSRTATERPAPSRTVTQPASLASAPDFLTVRELATVLRIGRNQAYALVNSGQVLSCRFGGSIRVPRTAVQRLLDAPSVPAASRVIELTNAARVGPEKHPGGSTTPLGDGRQVGKRAELTWPE